MQEVEAKFACSDLQRIATHLEAMGATRGATVVQEDLYYAHPMRDFAATDEALRVRTVNGAVELTYKGPRADGDAKVRTEYNVPSGQNIHQLLEHLGFHAAATVRKQRESWSWRDCEVTLDTVEGLGTYVEVEQINGDSEAVLAVAAALGLRDVEPRSYLELLNA